MGQEYRYGAEQRAEWIVDILASADDKPGHRAYALALAEYWGTAAPGDDSGEPAADGIEGVTWKVECALSADFAAIHQAERPEGTHGGDYSRDYIKLRGKARRNALLAARERRLKKEAAEQAADGLAGLLTFGPVQDQEGEEKHG
jgi:hypothetical protein